MDKGKRQKSIALPLLLMVIGVLLAGAAIAGPLLYLLVINPVAFAPEHRFVAPGSVTFTPTAGVVSIYLESRSVINGRAVVGSSSAPAGLQFRVTDAQGGVVPVAWSGAGSYSYASGAYEGRLVASAAVSTPGPLTVEASVASGSSGAPVIAVGDGSALGVFARLFGTLGGAVCAGFAGMALAIGGLVWLVVRLSGRASGQASPVA